ncbi:MAG: lycopene cyclase domain-containing protein [Verrucomicrobiota bacterium]
MTYWQYHLIFTLPIIAVLVVLLRKRITMAHIFSWLGLCLIVFAFTTPWDNYAVYLGIWGFGEGVSLGYPLSHLADQTPWVGHIPFEEYSFFLIEATMVCLVCLFFLPTKKAPSATTP